MTAVADYEEWSLALALCAGEALVVVGVPGQKGVWPNTHFFANRINLRQDLWACPMTAGVVGLSSRNRDVRRMVQSN